MLNHTVPSNVQLHLYKNNLTPDESDILTNYTESAAAGYSAVALVGSSWTFATVSGTSSATYPRQTFTYTTSEAVYGYYMTNRDTGGSQQIIWSERFNGAPYQIPTGGGTIDIDPKISLA
jgi:hypothetical protein